MSTANLYDNYVNGVKGWPSPYALDKHADVVDGQTIVKGKVMYINSAGEFALGLRCGAVGVIATRNSADADVRVSEGNMYRNMTGGVMAGIVTLGPYEVETTEYDTTQTYAPNQALTADNLGAGKGDLTVGEAYTDTLCGVVSDGLFTGVYRKTMLRFWTCWLPPLTCPSSPGA